MKFRSQSQSAFRRAAARPSLSSFRGYSRNARRPARRRRARIALTVIGVAGFVVLLALSARAPTSLAEVLRVAALAWFLVCGFVVTILR